MPLNIKDERAHEAARELARLRRTTITEAVTEAVEEALAKERAKSSSEDLAVVLEEISLHCASLPVLDNRSAEEILGYGASGLPDERDHGH